MARPPITARPGGVLHRRQLDTSLDYLDTQLASMPTFDGISAFVTLTQAEYDALSPKDPETLYIITE